MSDYTNVRNYGDYTDEDDDQLESDDMQVIVLSSFSI